ncbi:MAG: mycothiol conjugate amidase Mca [Acidimicrobiaceae bacterium]|nr:mycothiol conjugate amidase Mca [Acidimicrobiaceae bacterium]MCY4174942.1 mycothiol conjugate amidase Mca [Acidimicrobiaceae bacterium]MCY4279505.1 mycothiol conjugate amidase Mca [Acidimicrobiaceae bacterium]MCY4294471.1 mycothiol conjugate amidase Mca [Acidimicrobiaceae bacterium]
MATDTGPEGRLCLLTVHAHPDDEASKGAPTVARYHAEGVRTVLVCCTGGEEGEILNPALDQPWMAEKLAEVRAAELARAAQVIGYEEVVMLGYRDSGMAGSPANEHPECFAKADFEEAVSRLVEVIRRQRPQVMITYPEDQGMYQHPDHLRVYDISVPAFERAADPHYRPDLGEPWAVSKLYYTLWSRKRLEERHKAFGELGLESPYQESWFEQPSRDDEITTRVPVHDFIDARIDGLLAHATQIDPESSFWFGLPPEIERSIYPYDDYVLARGTRPAELPESDLFEGVRPEAPEASESSGSSEVPELSTAQAQYGRA